MTEIIKIRVKARSDDFYVSSPDHPGVWEAARTIPLAIEYWRRLAETNDIPTENLAVEVATDRWTRKCVEEALFSGGAA